MAVLIIPLSPIDNYLHAVGWTIGFQLDCATFDPKLLDEAAARVVRKWRLLAARVERDEQRNIYSLRVPTYALPFNYATHTFTTSESSNCLPFSAAFSSPTATCITPRPALAVYCDPGTPLSLHDHLVGNLPLLSIHVSKWANCTCVGISLPHGVFDGTGAGLVHRALEAELLGTKWDAPDVVGGNRLIESFNTLLGEYDCEEEARVAAVTSPAVESLGANDVQPVTRSPLVFKTLYLGDAVVAKLKSQASSELAVHHPDEFISSGDVLAAWVTKTIYSKSHMDTRKLSVRGYFGIRSLLETPSTPLATYPHNGIMSFSLPLIPLSSVPTLQLSSLAYSHRTAVLTSRTLPFIKGRLAHLKHPGPAPVNNVEIIAFSNQSSAGFVIGLGEKVVGMEIYVRPLGVRTVAINRVGSGWVVAAGLDEESWKLIRQEVDLTL